MRLIASRLALAAVLIVQPGLLAAAEIKVLTAGAMKSVVLALQGGFEAVSGHRLVIDNDTAGGLTRRIEAGEAFDVAIITPAAIDGLIEKARIVAGSRVSVAKVGVGVAMKEGRRSLIWARSMRSSARCLRPRRSLISIRPRAARAASMLRAF